eukprot:scaffold8253_cov267-Pinguiococcus_pyrenoidosus.AAC.7
MEDYMNSTLWNGFTLPSLTEQKTIILPCHIQIAQAASGCTSAAKPIAEFLQISGDSHPTGAWAFPFLWRVRVLRSDSSASMSNLGRLRESNPTDEFDILELRTPRTRNSLRAQAILRAEHGSGVSGCAGGGFFAGGVSAARGRAGRDQLRKLVKSHGIPFAPVGEGSYGQVYRARHRVRNEFCAVKVRGPAGRVLDVGSAAAKGCGAQLVRSNCALDLGRGSRPDHDEAIPRGTRPRPFRPGEEPVVDVAKGRDRERAHCHGSCRAHGRSAGDTADV